MSIYVWMRNREREKEREREREKEREHVLTHIGFELFTVLVFYVNTPSHLLFTVNPNTLNTLIGSTCRYVLTSCVSSMIYIVLSLLGSLLIEA